MKWQNDIYKEYNLNMTPESVRSIYAKLIGIGLVKGKKGFGYKRIGDPNADISSVIANGERIEKHAPYRAKRIYNEVKILFEVAANGGKYLSSSVLRKRVDAKPHEVTWAIRKLKREGLIAPKKTRGHTWVGPIQTHNPEKNPIALNSSSEHASMDQKEMRGELPFPFNYKINSDDVGTYKLSLTPPAIDHERYVKEDGLSTVIVTNRYGQEVDRVVGHYIRVAYVDMQGVRTLAFGEKKEDLEQKKEEKKGFFARLFKF